jgi:hypothetical protein
MGDPGSPCQWYPTLPKTGGWATLHPHLFKLHAKTKNVRVKGSAIRLTLAYSFSTVCVFPKILLYSLSVTLLAAPSML